jgi:hypothetical protein
MSGLYYNNMILYVFLQELQKHFFLSQYQYENGSQQVTKKLSNSANFQLGGKDNN